MSLAAFVLGCQDYSVGSVVVATTDTGAASDEPHPLATSTGRDPVAESGLATTTSGGSVDTAATGDSSSSSDTGLVCAPCPSLQDGDADLGRDPRIDGYFRAVLDLRQAVDAATATYATSLAALATAWDYRGDTGANATAVAGLMQHINAQIDAAIDGNFILQVTRLRCEADVARAWDEQARCEVALGCEVSRSCADTMPPDVARTCGGICVGSCGVGCANLALCPAQGDPGISCDGSCFGKCQVAAQSCPGKCIGQCDADPDSTGFCPGVCTGDCDLTQGGPCPGACLGECLDQATDLAACPEALACIGGCAEACGGACIGTPSLRVSESCGDGPCALASACDPTAGVRAAVSMTCEPLSVVPCFMPAVTLSPTALAAFQTRIDALATHASAVLQAHGQLSMVVLGHAPSALVNTTLSPAPAVALRERLLASLRLGVAGLDVPCPECAAQGLADGIAVTDAAVDDAMGLIAASNALRAAFVLN